MGSGPAPAGRPGMTDVGRRQIFARPHSVIDLTLVNSIHPGTTETEMGDQVLLMRARNLGTNDIEEARRQALGRLPIGRMGTVPTSPRALSFSPRTMPAS